METTKTNSSVRVNKSMVMKSAWLLIKNQKVASFAEALRKAWKAYKLKAQMALGVVKFAFIKTNGELRNAIGTLKQNMVNYQYKGTGAAKPSTCIAYFDIEKHAFRSFTIDSLI